MGKAEVLALLREEEYVSGEEISRRLGVSRAAVWKAIDALRDDGCRIDSAPNRGYCLRVRPLSEELVRAALGDCPWSVRVLDETDSTNNVLKRECTAPHGTVIITGKQTGGRGRLGRQFVSPRGGVYLSVLLRPQAAPEQLLHLTPMTAVAVRRAIFDCCGVSVDIKWTNDLVAGGKKLTGILTEMTTEVGSGMLQSVIVGIGVNCNTALEELPPEVQPMATSLERLAGHPVNPNALAAAMVRRLYEMDTALFSGREAWLREYAAACVTLGQHVQIVRGDERREAFAEGIDENGSLRVRYPDGSTGIVAAGEVSVRGMYGYV